MSIQDRTDLGPIAMSAMERDLTVLLITRPSTEAADYKDKAGNVLRVAIATHPILGQPFSFTVIA